MQWLKERLKQKRSVVLFGLAVLLCAAGTIVFLWNYFNAYRHPLEAQGVVDLSLGWKYTTGNGEWTELETLRTGPKLPAGTSITLSRELHEPVEQAAVLIRTNHQTVNVYLDGVPLYMDAALPPGANPGMALHYLTLPENYLGKTLTVELTSPYALYSGRTSPIQMGSIPALEALSASRFIRPVMFMSMCLLMGFSIIALTLINALKGRTSPQNLAIGLFAIVWALYYVSTEAVTFQFFSPLQMSALSLGLYFIFQAPLTLFFYYSFERYKKWMLPAVVLHCAFPAAAIVLSLTGIIQLPLLINANNILLAGLAYTVFLTVLEAWGKNRKMLLACPFLIIAYLSMLYNFLVFYTRQGTVPYSYRDTYLILLLGILIYDIRGFFLGHYQKLRENEALALQSKLATESYRRIKASYIQMGGLRHEVKNHLAAMQIYLREGRYEEAEQYLGLYTRQVELLTDVVYHESFLINTLVGELVHRAAEQHTSVELNLAAGGLAVADPDLYSLISNLLDNALEACKSVPEEDKPFIRFSISRRAPYLVISCENSRAGELLEENGVLKTTKGDESHGYGLEVVRRIASSYEGYIDVEYDSSTFTATALLRENSPESSKI